MRKKHKKRRRVAQVEGLPRARPTRSNRPRFFLETSGVIYHRHGHSLMKAAVEQAVADGLVQVSNFIRMEYMRGVVLNLIELYFLIKESDSVSDALIEWSQKVHQDRKLKIVLMTMPGWLVRHEDWQDKERSQRRLGELAVRLVYAFDDVFQDRSTDRLRCSLGRVRFPRQTFSEDMLLSFYERFKAIQSSIPDCSLCSFKERQQAEAARQGIDLYSTAQRQRFAANKGYVTQAERLEEAISSKDNLPKCRWCERLGDALIVLQAPKKAVLVTADKAFEAFGEILDRRIRRLPSLAELKRQIDQNATGKALE